MYFIWITKVLCYCKLNSKPVPPRFKRIVHVQINNPIYILFHGGFNQKTWIFSDYSLINTSPVGITTKNESLYKETETTGYPKMCIFSLNFFFQKSENLLFSQCTSMMCKRINNDNNKNKLWLKLYWNT